MDRLQIYLVSHTHWDREWYWSYARYRVNLLRVMRDLFEKLEAGGEFKHFVLDGQLAVLDDYLAAYPAEAGRIRALVEAGRVSLGPWYILPDEFLVSGEATVRNLQLGLRRGADLGGTVRVGYIPDSFGHLGQMPQILQQAGIDNFIYTRGNGDELDELGSEYWWLAPDGSRVLAVNQLGGYCNGAALGMTEIWEAHTRREISLSLAVEKARKLISELAEASNGKVLLFNNGCDHHPAQRDFDAVIRALREAMPECDFHHTGHTQFLEALKSAATTNMEFQGELLGGRHHHILSGVWSARMYLKQQNELAQTLLEQVLEPLAAAASLQHGRHYPQGLLDECWRTLLLNHPHDSICGCSVDEVHREMLTRFDHIIQSVEEELRWLGRDTMPYFAPQREQDTQTALAVFNPLPWRRDALARRMVILLPDDQPIEDLELVDEQDQVVPFDVIQRQWAQRFWNVDYRGELSWETQQQAFAPYRERFAERILFDGPQEPEKLVDQYIDLQFIARDLPAVGHKRYRLRQRQLPVSQSEPDRVTCRVNTLENGLIRVTLKGNGCFDMEDLRDGRRWQKLNLLVDVEDAGDEYDWSHCANSQTLTSAECQGEVSVCYKTSLAAALEARFTMNLPRTLNADRKSRDTELIASPVVVRVELQSCSTIVDVRVRFDNQAEDHRLRARFASGVHTEYLSSDGQFMVARRSLKRPDDAHWVQPAPDAFPQQDFSLVEKQGRGLALFNFGLPEIAAYQDEEGAAVMELTLLRAVGWLSRDDFPTRRNCNAGPTLFTPEAQCLGEAEYHYALMPCTKGVNEVASHCEEWRIPAIVRQGVLPGSLPDSPSLVEVKGEGVRVSSLHLHRERGTLVIRLWNMQREDTCVELFFGKRVLGAWSLDLEEERKGELPFGDPALSLVLNGAGILSVEVALGEK